MVENASTHYIGIQDVLGFLKTNANLKFLALILEPHDFVSFDKRGAVHNSSIA